MKLFSFFRNKMKLILKSWKPKRLMGLRVHHGGFKLANWLEWRSAVAYVRCINVDLMVQLKERLKAP